MESLNSRELSHGGKDLMSIEELREELRKSEARFSRLYNKIPVMIHSVSSQGFLESVNDTWLQKMGYSREEVLGKKVDKFLTAESKEKAETEIKKLYSNGHCKNIEYEFVKKDGAILDVLLSATFESENKDSCFAQPLAVIIDLTEKKKNEQKAKALAKRLDLALKVSGIGVWDWDITNNHLIWDPAMYNLYGYDKGDFPNAYEAWYATVLPEDRDRANEEVERAIYNDEAFDTQFRIYHKDGGVRHIRAIGTVVKSRNGKSIKMVGLNWDITQEKELEEARQNEQIQMIHSARLANIGEMAAGIAHEINNPLMVIKSQFEIMDLLLQSGQLDPKRLAKISARVGGTVDRMSKIINGLRNFSRDGNTDDMEEVLVRDLIAETLDFCQRKFEDQGIEIRCPEVDKSIKVRCRRIQVSQVLLNLIQNSRDAVVNSNHPWIEISGTKGHDGISIAVTDSGRGISEELEEKMFDPFYTTKEIGKGTGLGLSISQNVMRSHGGDLHLARDCENTRFNVVFPLPS